MFRSSVSRALALSFENRDAYSGRNKSRSRLKRIVLQSSMSRLRLPILFTFVIYFLAAATGVCDDINKISPTGYVTDLAGVIPQATKQRLETLCTELEQKTGAQMAVVTVKSLDDRPAEDYAVDLFKHLGVGAKKDNTGVQLLVAPNDRKYRIEVGYGLEPIINDARTGDAGRAMLPFLRQNDYASAIEIAAWQLAKYIADDKGVTLSGQPPARPRPVANTRGRGSPINPFVLLIIVFIVFRIFGSLISRASGGRGGGMSGCWWILPFLMSGGGGRGGGGSDWGGGGFGGGGGGGGGFGGFGGGSSGGGGASGSW